MPVRLACPQSVCGVPVTCVCAGVGDSVLCRGLHAHVLVTAFGVCVLRGPRLTRPRANRAFCVCAEGAEAYTPAGQRHCTLTDVGPPCEVHVACTDVCARAHMRAPVHAGSVCLACCIRAQALHACGAPWGVRPRQMRFGLEDKGSLKPQPHDGVSGGSQHLQGDPGRGPGRRWRERHQVTLLQDQQPASGPRGLACRPRAQPTRSLFSK